MPADAFAGVFDAAAVADALVSLLSRLHRAGIRHGDLKASHVYLAPGAAGLAARLIDLEGVRFTRRVPERARIRELAQLNASLPDALPDAIRCRAFERYRAALPFRSPAQRSLRRIVAASLARSAPLERESVRGGAELAGRCESESGPDLEPAEGARRARHAAALAELEAQRAARRPSR